MASQTMLIIYGRRRGIQHQAVTSSHSVKLGLNTYQTRILNKYCSLTLTAAAVSKLHGVIFLIVHTLNIHMEVYYGTV